MSHARTPFVTGLMLESILLAQRPSLISSQSSAYFDEESRKQPEHRAYHQGFHDKLEENYTTNILFLLLMKTPSYPVVNQSADLCQDATQWLFYTYHPAEFEKKPNAYGWLSFHTSQHELFPFRAIFGKPSVLVDGLSILHISSFQPRRHHQMLGNGSCGVAKHGNEATQQWFKVVVHQRTVGLHMRPRQQSDRKANDDHLLGHAGFTVREGPHENGSLVRSTVDAAKNRLYDNFDSHRYLHRLHTEIQNDTALRAMAPHPTPPDFLVVITCQPHWRLDSMQGVTWMNVRRDSHLLGKRSQDDRASAHDDQHSGTVLTEVGEFPSESVRQDAIDLVLAPAPAQRRSWRDKKRLVEHGVCEARTILQASSGHNFFCGSNTTPLHLRDIGQLVDQSGTNPRGTLGPVIDQP
ncbi:uncharacterized protein MYCFIDRAFT_179551 [Pseudocercospora fijiensis CIRAD86]|uniref:Uncharacterized protein n=1 Tax=Pseudocercospora fijiensis (strain CIRAD86) TaxID=383855 RepID=M3A128_PSEFD|nr:uncharacterized protein MYCFIDRAFT_179551 [Pseudocercospora fijiensis CIRAD86]EME78101.1 hypothetical protein MYCFIDRAFT_179551 [Pseudocercospora fijiensis CIRAD86]